MLGKLKSILNDLVFNKPLKNIYNTNFNRNVLISYIQYPFRRGISYHHSNQKEAIIIAEIFSELGFNVDIYHYKSLLNIRNIDKYNIIFGMGPLYEKLVKERENNILYIYYATGADPCFQNRAEIRRLKMLWERKGVILSQKRKTTIEAHFSTILSDYIITTGNDWTISTYSTDVPIYNVPISVYDIEWKENIKRDFRKAKKNFLWFGSSGLVHKGLDLCLEVFKDLPNYHLYICGPKEEDFFKVYKKELNLPNIHYEGFINIKSKKFKEIVEKCAFSIFPSCSEGQSGSLLTTMGVGLIPIATKMTGVDIKNRGFITNDNIENIKSVVLNVSKLNDETLQILSYKNIKFIETNHTIHNFKNAMLNILSNLIK